MGTAESPMTADDGSQDPGTWLFPRSLSAPPTRPPSPARFQASCLRQHSGRHHLHRGGAGGAREPGGRNGGGPEERGRLVRARPSRSSLPGGPRSRNPAPGPSTARAGPPYPPPRPQGGACMPSLGLAELAPLPPRWRGGGAGRRALEGCPGPPRPASSTRPPLPGCGTGRGLGPGGGGCSLGGRRAQGGSAGRGGRGCPEGHPPPLPLPHLLVLGPPSPFWVAPKAVGCEGRGRFITESEEEGGCTLCTARSGGG